MQCLEYVLRKIRIWVKKLLAPFRRRKWLFLDDMRNPPVYLRGHFDVVRDFDEFTEHIESYGVPGLISFDHDLHPSHTMFFYEGNNWCGPCESKKKDLYLPTGYDCAVWLIEYCEGRGLVLDQVCVHSPNDVTARKISKLVIEHQRRNNTRESCKTIRWGVMDYHRG